MDITANTTETDNSNFGVELGKTVAQTAAASAASILGMALALYTWGKIVDIKEKRAAKKQLAKTVEK